MEDGHRHLAWFLGPKAENEHLVEELMMLVLRDYFHWRKNYFPADPVLITKARRRDHVSEHDELNEVTHRLLARLRRNFPFYSPRYIAHQLSDTLIPSMVGYVAGMLYNPNNVTPEAAPVTTQLEIECCSIILSMLGYTPPPKLPDDQQDPDEYYEKASHKAFGWAHLTSGGTVANIESLWVARQVKYFPLAAKFVAKQEDLRVSIKLPNGTTRDLRRVANAQLTMLKTNEAIYLLPKLIDALRIKMGIGMGAGETEKVMSHAWRLFSEAPYSLSKGTGQVFAKHPPAIFVAGPAHYSIRKAADVLGMGSASVRIIDVDEQFRVDVGRLRQSIRSAVNDGLVPLCVVANMGTTEEGAVDPLHDISDLRDELERQDSISFWLHADAAWGGYIRSLFTFSESTALAIRKKKLSKYLRIRESDEWSQWHKVFAQRIHEKLHISEEPATDEIALMKLSKTIRIKLDEMNHAVEGEDKERYLSIIERFPGYFATMGFGDRLRESEFRQTLTDIHDYLISYVRTKLNVPSHGTGMVNKMVSWPSHSVCNSFVALPLADSITVDPHKLGYAPYPAGCVAFRNDRIRSFIVQDAPYITALSLNPLSHRPPMHTIRSPEDDSKFQTRVVSFAPFMLEGSKPGAAASGVWLGTNAVPLTSEKHGSIVRASILAARALYEWLSRWNSAHDGDPQGIEYKIVLLTPGPPDLNIVTFAVKKKASNSLLSMNEISKRVYQRFTILSELGAREYSYSQSFFLSNTRMTATAYSAASLGSFFERCGFGADATREYVEEGVVVLRAAVMNPYITPSRELGLEDTIRAFVEELARAAEEAMD